MSTDLSSVKYQDLLADAKSKIAASATNTQSAASTDSQASASGINSVWDAASDADLYSLGTNAASKAQQDTESLNKEIDNNIEDATKISQKTQEKVDEILSQCSENTEAIQNALAAIEALGGDQGQIKEAEAKLEEQLDIIESNKEILNDPSKSSSERLEALKAILGAAAVIKGLVSSVEGWEETVEAQNDTVQENTESIAASITDVTDTVDNGTKDIQKCRQISQTQKVSVQNQQTMGAAYNKVGEEYIATGEAMQSNPATSSGAELYISSGNDKVKAGTIRNNFATNALGTLDNADAQYSSYLSDFSGKLTDANNYLTEADNLVGQYDTTVNAVIESIGSWNEVESANEEFQDYVEEYKSSLSSNVKEQLGESSVDISGIIGVLGTAATIGSQVAAQNGDTGTASYISAASNYIGSAFSGDTTGLTSSFTTGLGTVYNTSASGDNASYIAYGAVQTLSGIADSIYGSSASDNKSLDEENLPQFTFDTEKLKIQN